jgi:hypothetical protein
MASSHGLSSSVGSNIPIGAYGVVLILVMLVFPAGIQGGLRRLLAAFTGPDNRKAGTWRADLIPPRDEAPADQPEKEGTT